MGNWLEDQAKLAAEKRRAAAAAAPGKIAAGRLPVKPKQAASPPARLPLSRETVAARLYGSKK